MVRMRGDVFGRADGHEVAAFFARLGAHVDHPVGRLDDVQVVLDDHHRVAQIDQAIEHVQQLGQVVEVQPGGGLVQEVEGPSGVGAGELGGQFHPLGLAAGERGGGLAQGNVAQADVAERLQNAADLGDLLEQPAGLVAGHVQHVGDRLAVVADGQRLGVVAAALAGLAFDPNVGQEVHLDLELPVALALLAASAGHVEAETAGRVAAELGLGKLGEQLADQVEHAGEGGRVRGGRLAQGLLVDADHLVDLLQPADRVVGPGEGLRPVQRPRQGVVEHVLDQRALAAAAGTGDHGEAPQRDGGVDALQVIVPGAEDLQPAAARRRDRRRQHANIMPQRLSRLAAFLGPLARGH